MTQPPRVRWSDDRADLVGSPRNLQKRYAAYQAGGLSQQETGQPATQPDPTLSSGENANQEPSSILAKMSSPRCSRTLWADKWQR